MSKKNGDASSKKGSMIKRILVYTLVVIAGFLVFSIQITKFLPGWMYRTTIRESSRTFEYRGTPRISEDGRYLVWIDPKEFKLLIGTVSGEGDLADGARAIGLPALGDGEQIDELAIEWSSGGSLLVVSCEKWLLAIDAETGDVVKRLGVQDIAKESSASDIGAACVSADGAWLAAVDDYLYSSRKTIALFTRGSTGFSFKRRLVLSDDPWKILLSENGRYLLSISYKGVELLETTSGRLVADAKALLGTGDTRLREEDARSTVFRRGSDELFIMSKGALRSFDCAKGTSKDIFGRDLFREFFLVRGDRSLEGNRVGSIIVRGEGEGLKCHLLFDPSYRGDNDWHFSQFAFSPEGDRVAVLTGPYRTGSEEVGRSQLDILPFSRLSELSLDHFLSVQDTYVHSFVALLIVLCVLWELLVVKRLRNVAASAERAGAFARQSASAERAAAPVRQAAGPASAFGRVQLVCPRCGAGSSSDHPQVLMQWNLLESGSSISGGVVLHCHACAFSAPLSAWFEAAKKRSG